MIQTRRKSVGTRETGKDGESEREAENVCTQEAAFVLVLHRQWSANWRTVITVAITADTFHIYVTASLCCSIGLEFSCPPIRQLAR